MHGHRTGDGAHDISYRAHDDTWYGGHDDTSYGNGSTCQGRPR
jgi:hypothetical protein